MKLELEIQAAYYLSWQHLASCTKLELLRAFFNWRELHTYWHKSHTHTPHTRTNTTHAHAHTSHTHTDHTRTHTLSSHCARRMVAHLFDKFKCLKGLTFPCVCTYLQEGITPLYRAAYYGHIEVVRHLVSSGADVNKANNVSVCRHWLW